MKKIILTLCSYFFISTLSAEEVVISLVIDDVGNNYRNGLQVVNLPGEVTLAFLPQTPYSTELAELAHKNGKQVMLHLPMESEQPKSLGPSALTLGMTEQEYKNTVHMAIDSIPHVMGLNNHMGSLVTSDRESMVWLMDVIRDKQLFFIDSRTTEKTVAQETALKMGVPTFKRDIFLDNSQDEEDILSQFNLLISLAKRNGYATGIGHPYSATINVLEKQIPLLKEKGIKLVFASEILNEHIDKRRLKWQESSSLSPKVVKNSKL